MRCACYFPGLYCELLPCSQVSKEETQRSAESCIPVYLISKGRREIASPFLVNSRRVQKKRQQRRGHFAAPLKKAKSSGPSSAAAVHPNGGCFGCCYRMHPRSSSSRRAGGLRRRMRPHPRFKGDVRKCDGSNVGPNRQHSSRPAYGAPTALKALALAVRLAGAHSAFSRCPLF